MKIVDVKSAVLGTAWRNLTFVRVITDEGLEGVGEVRMLNHTDALRGYLAEAVPNHVLGHDPFDIESLVRGMYLNDFARAGEIAMSAIATIEVACWDIMGQALGLPVYKLLGGAVREKIKAYALQDQGLDTVEANLALGYKADPRDYGIGIQLLKDLGLRRVRLLTNNPKKTDAFIYGGFDLEVVDQVPIVAAPNEHNAHYLATKRKKLGHQLPD